MEFNKEEIAKFEELVLASKNTLLLTHKNPDGDALGALLALYLVFEKSGRNAVPACFDKPPSSFEFLPKQEKVVCEFNENNFDLVIVVDCGDIKQTGFLDSKPTLWDGSKKVVKIDHHAMSGDAWGDVQLVCKEAAASCCILLHLFEQLGIPIRPDIATCLLTGISTDTGSFRHSNTSPLVLRSAAKLLRLGANNPVLSKNIYKTTPLPALKLWGKILQTIKQTGDGVTVAVALKEDFENSKASQEDLAGVVDYVNAIPNAKFSILLSERNGLVKASLRTQSESADVAKIASAFGGGGHIKAAGFAIEGRLEKEERWKVVRDDGEERIV